MTPAVRWIIVVAAILLVVGLIVWARGLDHMRGDEVGSLPLVSEGGSHV